MTQPRELWVTYHGTTEPELIVDGAVSDAGILDLHANILSREVNAWLLNIMGQLPDWWRKIDVVQFKNLVDHKDEEFRPGDEAAGWWETASVKERVSMQKGWRVVPRNQIYRLKKDTQRIVSMPVHELDPLDTGEVSVVPVRIPKPQPKSKLIIPERRLIRI